REHPGSHPDAAAGDLRPGPGEPDGRSERARAGRRRHRVRAALRPEPVRAPPVLGMSGAVAVAITKRLPGFTLDVSWAAEQSVLGLFGPSGAAARRPRAAHRPGDRAARARRTGATLSARALRRPAPACGAGPGARDRPGAPAAR